MTTDKQLLVDVLQAIPEAAPEHWDCPTCELSSENHAVSFNNHKCPNALLEEGK